MCASGVDDLAEEIKELLGFGEAQKLGNMELKLEEPKNTLQLQKQETDKAQQQEGRNWSLARSRTFSMM